MESDLERLLEAIGREATSDSSNEAFLIHLLDALVPLLDASFAALIAQVGPAQMLCVRATPSLGRGREQDLANHFLGMPASASVGQFHGASVVSYGRATGSGGSEFLVVGLTNLVDAAAEKATVGILEAFSELLEIREAKWTSRLMRDYLGPIVDACAQFTSDRSPVAASQRLVDLLCFTLRAARVTLFRPGHLKCLPRDLLAISSLAEPDTSGEAVGELAGFASDALLSRSPVRRSATAYGNSEATGGNGADPTGFLLPEGLAFSFPASAERPPDGVLVLEWSERSAMIESLPALRQGLPLACQAWAQQVRWLRIPRWLRPSGTQATGSSKHWNRSLPWLLLAAGLVAAWMALQVPTPMEVVAPATLHPKLARSIFASTDGFLKELFVEDGQSVQAGQPLLAMYSPSLEIQIEEVMGRLQSIAEKRNGLSVAIMDQRNALDASVQENRMASEILVLEKQEAHAQEELELLRAERSRLIVQSPIDGTIVTRELRKELEDRPLKRGDKLFEVMDLQGPWQLHVELADRDSIWVRKHNPSDHESIRFVFESLPRERFWGKIAWIGPAIESSPQGAVFLPVRVDIDQEVADRSYLGARASAWFPCGSQPLWYVWTRPLVDAIQIRFGWFGARS
jgi:hypothetical protein